MKLVLDILPFLKKNYGWIMVSILSIFPMFIILNLMVNDLFISEINHQNTLEMLYHISGEFAIRWMTAVLSLTPFFIIFGVVNLFVRQAMGIATAIWSFIHFIIFIWAEGFFKTFTQVNYVFGFIAVLILIPLFFTSNRASMKRLKNNWKKLQKFAYATILLSLIHICILDKTWIIYAVIISLGFIIRVPFVKNKIITFRQNRNIQTLD